MVGRTIMAVIGGVTVQTMDAALQAEYQLIEIRIFAAADGGANYPVEVDVAGWRSFPPGLLQLDRARLTETDIDPKAYGRALGEMLFASAAIGGPYRETVAAIQANGSALRLRLRLDPPELYSISWERALAPADGDWLPLAVNATTPFSRHILAQGWARPQPVMTRPLRLHRRADRPGAL
jgi:hypothetical protein